MWGWFVRDVDFMINRLVVRPRPQIPSREILKFAKLFFKTATRAPKTVQAEGLLWWSLISLRPFGVRARAHFIISKYYVPKILSTFWAEICAMTVGKFTTCEVNKAKILNSTNQGVFVINACFEVLMRKPIDKRLYIVQTTHSVQITQFTQNSSKGC